MTNKDYQKQQGRLMMGYNHPLMLVIRCVENGGKNNDDGGTCVRTVPAVCSKFSALPTSSNPNKDHIAGHVMRLLTFFAFILLLLGCRHGHLPSDVGRDDGL